jgi:hypothetical protein
MNSVPGAEMRAVGGPAWRRRVARSAARLDWRTWSLVGLLLWLPLSTPVAVLAFQYLGLSAGMTRGLLLTKDVAAAVLVLVLFLQHGRHLRWRLFDALAVVYGATVVVYSVVPLVAGSEVPVSGIVASARQMLVPVGLYAIGRLAVAGGVRVRVVATAALAVSIGVVVLTAVQHLVLPVSVLATSYDLVAFVREVQGFPGADNLWNISILGQYTGSQSLEFARAVGPFTHPVGAGHYLVLALALTTAAAFHLRLGWRRLLYGAALLAGLTVIFTISRGSWMAAVIAVGLVALAYRRLPHAAAGLALAGLVIVLVPSLNVSITSALSGQDPSTGGHAYAVEKGVGQIIDDPFGSGMGSADKFASVDAGEDGVVEDLGVGENMYLSIFINAGPIALLSFLGWYGGAALALLKEIRVRPEWLTVAVLAAAAGYALSAMTSSPLMRFTTSGTFWLLLGLAVGAAAAAGHRASPGPSAGDILPPLQPAARA